MYMVPSPELALPATCSPTSLIGQSHLTESFALHYKLPS